MAQKNRVANQLEYGLALLLLAVLRWSPRRLGNGLALLAARTLDLAVPKLRRVAMINLGFAWPELDLAAHRKIVDGVFNSIARLLMGLAYFPSLHAANIGKWVGYEGLENYRAAKRAGKGVLVATAHFGNWELSAFAHALLTEPMHVMIRPLDNPLIDRIVEERRASSGNQLVHKRDAARTVLKALRTNAAIGILIDQNTTPAEGVFVDFFGKPACASSAFVKLAYHSGAAVIPGFALWHQEQQRYIIHFLPRIEMTGDLERDTQQIHSILESWIRQYPDQWLWIHRRWKSRPPGEASLY